MPEGMEIASDIKVPKGNLHRLVPVRYNGGLYLLRFPRNEAERRPVITALRQEYEGLGFIALGGSWKLRSLAQQVEFSRLCEQRQVPMCRLESVDGWFLAEYHEGLRLSRYLCREDANPEVVIAFLESVVAANKQGLVIGDRWTPNVLVTNGDILHIDGDIHLEGDVASEFELAQAIHYGSQSANPAVQETVANWLIDRVGLEEYYDMEIVDYFLQTHRRYGELHPDMNPYPTLLGAA